VHHAIRSHRAISALRPERRRLRPGGDKRVGQPVPEARVGGEANTELDQLAAQLLASRRRPRDRGDGANRALSAGADFMFGQATFRG
jgi:hypothetical protein